MDFPLMYRTFIESDLLLFTPWIFSNEVKRYEFASDRFEIESIGNRKVLAFGARQDMDTFVGFEIENEVVTNKVVVFHPSFKQNIYGWNIIKSDYIDIYSFLKNVVLPDMKDWFEDENDMN